MRTIRVRLPFTPYRIEVGRRVLEKIPSLLKGLGLSGKVLVVTEKRVARLHLARVRKALKRGRVGHEVFYLPGGERAKQPREITRLHRFLLRKDFERRDAVLALGGGAVGDAAGFAAATYLRGVPLIQAGTTLLAQVDSSIGGKTGINLPEGKNLAGCFYQPRLVLSDVEVLKTLPGRELRASLAEVIKYGMICDASLFGYLEKRLGAILGKDPGCLEEVVFRSAGIKAGVVERDEKETRGERMILNYGHTFGHAFEAARNFSGILHGEAVALGMVCAARLAVRRGIFSPEAEQRQNRLIERAGLPTTLKPRRFNPERVVDHLLRDKKKKAGKLCLILPERIGKVRVAEAVPLGEIKRVLSELGGK